MPLEIAVEPGKHAIEITRPGAARFENGGTVAPDGHELVAITPPVTRATLFSDWPAAKRTGAELTVHGAVRRSRRLPKGRRCDSPLSQAGMPCDHGKGFETYSKSVVLAAWENQAIKPSWTPEKNAPTVVDSPPPIRQPGEQEKPEIEPIRTATVGGDGGSRFEDTGPPGSLLVGLEITTGMPFNHLIVTSIRPLFSDPNGDFSGGRRRPRGGRSSFRRKPATRSAESSPKGASTQTASKSNSCEFRTTTSSRATRTNRIGLVVAAAATK